MKRRISIRIISVLLIALLTFYGCTEKTEYNISEDENEISIINNNEDSFVIINGQNENSEEDIVLSGELEFESLNDENLLKYIEDDLYNQIVAELDSDDYFVQSITAKYVSQEYIDEMEFNSRSNIFFGYSLEELDSAFQGTRYVFSLGDNGETIVKEYEAYDDTYEKVIKNVAIGTGVILVCVVIAVVTDGMAVPAISMIFATAAKTGTIAAISSATFSALASGIVTGITTHDVEATLKAAALEGSNSFKWGAITGALSGGAGETIGLYNASLNGLTMNEAAIIQKESGMPLQMISEMHDMGEYEVFKQAGLETRLVNGKNALIKKDIDFDLVDNKGRTNLERMKKGLAAIDKDGKSYELHHIGQESDATLTMLSQSEHDSKILHGYKTVSEINRTEFEKTRKAFWKEIARLYETGKLVN